MLRIVAAMIVTALLVVPAVPADLTQGPFTTVRIYAALGIQKPSPRMTPRFSQPADDPQQCLYYRCSAEDPPCCPEYPICVCTDTEEGDGECQCRASGDQ
jgi:hypothetical protein